MIPNPHQRLLGLTPEDGQAYEEALLEGGLEVLRPGFTRFSLAYYHADPEVRSRFSWFLVSCHACVPLLAEWIIHTYWQPMEPFPPMT